ncbi:MAG: TldD protein [Archaeoglobi archaeon]|nr:TldD protein [Archaeoglobi archaeon]MDK2782207.1 TldD protein [Archaeoglobi archaeon]
MNFDFHDFRILRAEVTEITVENGEITNLMSYSRTSGIARVLKGDSWGVYSFEGNLEPEEAVRRAGELVFLSARETSVRVNDEVTRLKLEVKAEKDPRDIDVEEKLEVIMSSEELLKDERVKSTRILYSDIFFDFHYENSFGSDSSYSLSKSGIALSCIALENGEMEMGYRSHFNLGGFEVVEENYERLAEEAKKVALELLHARRGPKGRVSVIMDQELAGVFIHEAVGHAVEADLVIEGNSKFEGMLGKQVASSLVTVVDDPTERAYGFYPVDDEGARARRRVLIENGILKSFLHSRETSAKLGGEPGNARAQWNSVPLVRMSNTFMLPGEMSRDELFEGFTGVYLLGSRGGQVSTADGIFQFSAERGYVVKNGEILHPIKNSSISGEIIELLRNVEALSDDLKLNSGRCGKKNQTVSVSDGAPHVRLREAVLG